MDCDRALSRAELPPGADISAGVLALHDEFYVCRWAPAASSCPCTDSKGLGYVLHCAVRVVELAGLKCSPLVVVRSNAECQKVYWQGSQFSNALQDLCTRIVGLDFDKRLCQLAG